MKKQILILGFLASTAFGFGQSWNIGGNAGTNPASPAFNYLGTSDNKALVLRANGQEGIRILPSTFVGIGNANPLHKLSVAGNIAFNQNLVSRTQNASIHWGTGGPGYLSFRVLTGAENSLGNYIERMIIDQNGNVGIGPNALAPSQKLDVDGNISIRGGHVVFNSNTGVIDWGAGGTGDLIFRTLSTQGDIWSYTDRIKIKNNGWINIGGNSGNNSVDPSDQLQIFATNGASGITITQNYAGNSALTLHNANGTGKSYSIRSTNNGNFSIYDNNNFVDRLVINNSGNVKIGTKSSIAHPTAKLSVDGKIACSELYVVNDWADFVFDKEYKLPLLKDVEAYYKANKHLPEIPSASEVKEKGISVGEMNKLLLQKIEELTIYMVEQQKEIEILKEKVK